MITAKYGAWRLLSKHPMTRPQYVEWLSNTPWTAQHPLPDGPVLLQWQDAIVVGTLQLLIWLRLEPIPFLGVIIFAYAYLIPCALYLRILKLPTAAYSICFLLTLPFLSNESSLIVFAFSIFASLLISQQSLPKSLEYCVQKMRNGDNCQNLISTKDPEPSPLSRLQMELPKRQLSRPESIALSLLIGVLVYLIFDHPSNSDFQLSISHCLMIIGVPIFINFIYFINRHQAPLSLAGRIKSRKFVIPSFDSIYVAPLIVLGVTFLLLPILNDFIVHPGIVGGIIISYTLIILLNVGPTEEEFNLTGAHQIRSIQQRYKSEQAFLRESKDTPQR